MEIGSPVLLVDKLANKNIDWKENSTYSFTTELGIFTDRFALQFSKSITSISTEKEPEISITSIGNLIQITGNTNQGEVRLFNVLGQSLLFQKLTSDATVLTIPYPDGCYIINVRTDKQSITQKVIINQ